MAFVTNKDEKVSNIVYVVAGLFTVALAILIVGIAMEKNCQSKARNKSSAAAIKLERLSQFCKYSQEADRIGLNAFLMRVQKAYFDTSPNQVAYDPDVKYADMHEHLKKRYHFKVMFTCNYLGQGRCNRNISIHFHQLIASLLNIYVFRRISIIGRIFFKKSDAENV